MMCTQAGAGGFWHDAFKLMSAIPVSGVIAIRVIEIFRVSQSIVLTVCFAVISVMLGRIFPVSLYFFCRIRNWMSNSEHGEGGNGILTSAGANWTFCVNTGRVNFTLDEEIVY